MGSRKLGIVVSYINTGLNMFSGMFLSAYLLRMLGALEYGIYQTIASFANYLVILQFGTGTVMTRNIAMCRAKKASQDEIDRNINTIWSITWILCLMILAVGIVFYRNIYTIYAKTMNREQLQYAGNIFVFVLVHLIASFILHTINGAILGYENYSFGSFTSIIRTGIRIMFLTALIFMWRRSVIIAQLDATITICQLCFTIAYAKKRFNIQFKMCKPDKEILQTTVPLCIALFLQAIVNQANNNVDKFLIGVLLSPECVAVYSVGMFVYSAFSSLTTIPISIYAPMVAKEIQLGTPMRELERKMVKPCRITAIIGGLVFFGFLAVGRQFISLLYGEEYLIAWPIALIIMIPMYINMINGVLVNVLDAMNKRLVRSLILMGTTIVNVVLTFFWLRIWGIIGAALATAVCTFVGQVLILNLYYAKNLNIRITVLFRESLYGVFSSFFLSCTISMLVGHFITSHLISFLFSGGVFLVIWAVYFLWRGTTTDEKKFLYKHCNRGQLVD